jgi:hypothetical protein
MVAVMTRIGAELRSADWKSRGRALRSLQGLAVQPVVVAMPAFAACVDELKEDLVEQFTDGRSAIVRLATDVTSVLARTLKERMTPMTPYLVSHLIRLVGVSLPLTAHLGHDTLQLVLQHVRDDAGILSRARMCVCLSVWSADWLAGCLSVPVSIQSLTHMTLQPI